MTVFPACLSALIVSTGASNRSISYMTTFFVVLIVPIEYRISKVKLELYSTLQLPCPIRQ